MYYTWKFHSAFIPVMLIVKFISSFSGPIKTRNRKLDNQVRCTSPSRNVGPPNAVRVCLENLRSSQVQLCRTAVYFILERFWTPKKHSLCPRFAWKCMSVWPECVGKFIVLQKTIFQLVFVWIHAPQSKHEG